MALNVDPDEITLVEVRSNAFDRVEMHKMAVVDESMKMQRLDNLVIPANAQVRFEPGGQHLMMKGPVTTYEWARPWT